MERFIKNPLLSQSLSLVFVLLLIGFPPGYAYEIDTATSAEQDSFSVASDGPEIESHIEQTLSDPSQGSAPQLLDSEEFEELTARADEPGSHVAGGALTTQQLTYVVIALAAAVFVLILK